MSKPSTEQIDQLLPQTQCGLCDYAGCKPYADAIAHQGERIDRCPPGGIKTLRALGELLDINPEPYVADMQQKQKPAQVAVIREEACIGCTKCIPPCPVDAIVGSGKRMHTILADVCTGCELCIEPCPMDCIDLVEVNPHDDIKQKQISDASRERYHWHQQRTERDEQEKRHKHKRAKLENNADTLAARKAAIMAAVKRSRNKK